MTQSQGLAFRMIKRTIEEFRPWATGLLLTAADFTLQLVATGILLSLAAILVFVVKPLGWLPPPNETDTLLGALLAAQAAIAALTIAVTLFMMQGINNRQDVDDRIYREYVTRSWVKELLRNSLLAVGVTGTVLLGQKLVSGIEGATSVAPGLPNLVFLAIAAFVSNLVFAGALFERAVHLARPQELIDLRRYVNERDVRQALQAFLRRRTRAEASLLANEPDVTTILPDPAEGSSDDAVRELLDEARRAMRGGRQREFTRTIDSITTLLKYAMDEIEKTDLKWSPPGRQPDWPPLIDLWRNLYSFREDVIGQGNRDYVMELLKLDYWLVTTAMDRRCGEMFTTGLSGYQLNYRMADRLNNSELRHLLRDSFSLDARGWILILEANEMFPYAMEMVRHQERILADAMHLDQAEDYMRLHSDFDSVLNWIRSHWEVDSWPEPAETQLYQQLQQEYGIALMGLAGRAVLVNQTQSISSTHAYLEIAREQYPQTSDFTRDTAQALNRETLSERTLWREWETEYVPIGQVYSIQTEQYPLAFFAVRLMELITAQDIAIDLHGRAAQVSQWFANNIARVEQHIQADAGENLNERRELAEESLRSAIRRDQISEEYNIIERSLSPERVLNFTSGVRTTATGTNPIEKAFREAGAYLHLHGADKSSPVERGCNRLAPKAHLAQEPVSRQISYTSLEGGPLGQELSYDITRLFEEALTEAPTKSASLDTAGTLLQAIDDIEEGLGANGELLVMLVGDWFDTEIALNREKPDGYLPQWQLQQDNTLWKIGQYRKHLIVKGPKDGDRRLYVVDTKTWGLFVRGRFEDGEDVRVDITPISAERAQELLASGGNYFPNEPDEDSKLRKLQTMVQIKIGARHGFRVVDQERAQQIVHNQESNQQGAFHPPAVE